MRSKLFDSDPGPQRTSNNLHMIIALNQNMSKFPKPHISEFRFCERVKTSASLGHTLHIFFFFFVLLFIKQQS